MADVIEEAKTGRARCRRCGEPIPKATLRFGEKVENPFGEGEATQWYHLLCGAEKRPQKVADVLAAHDGDVPERAALDSALADGLANPKLSSIRRADRAPTGRARCQHCRETIEKGTLRVGVERDDDMPNASVSYLHAHCAKAALDENHLLSKLRRVSTTLTEEDLAELEAAVAASR